MRDVAKVGLVLIAAVLAGDLALLGHRLSGGSAAPGSLPAPAPSAEGPTGGADPAGVGPLPKTQIDGYVDSRADALTAATAADPGGTRVAVVSFTNYLTPAEYTARIPAGMTTDGVFVRVPVTTAGGADVDTPGALLRPTAAMPLTGQLGALATQLGTDGATGQLEAGALSGGRNVIYAGLVVGTTAALAALAATSRLVDLAPPGSDPATVVAHGLLPEDLQVTSPVAGVDGFTTP